MKKTKQQIIDELTSIKEELILKNKEAVLMVDRYVLNDERIRKEFAEAFGWYQDRSYHLLREPKLPSWEQIFVKIGRLLNSDNFNDLRNQFNGFEDRLIRIEQQIEDEKINC